MCWKGSFCIRLHIKSCLFLKCVRVFKLGAVRFEHSVYETRQRLCVWESFEKDVKKMKRERDCVHQTKCSKWEKSACVSFFFSQTCSVGMWTAVASSCVWLGGTEPDSRQKRAGPSRRGRSAIRGCNGGTGQPAAAALHEGRGHPAFRMRVRVRATV